MNIKLSHAISFLTIISIITTVLLSLIGFQKINLLKNNIYNMYNIDVQKIELGRAMSSQIAVIHTDVKNQIIDYQAELDETINDNLDDINALINSYLEICSDENDKKNADVLLNNIIVYREAWNEINELLKNGTEINNEKYLTILVYEKTNIDSLNRLSSNNNTNAQKKYFSSLIAAEKAGKQFIETGSVSILLLIAISIIVVFYTKNSLNKIVDTMNTAAEGNFNIAIECDGKNEFGIINKAISKTIKSVSLMISRVIEKMDNIVVESKMLDEVAKDMLTSSKDIYNSIRVMAEGSTSQAQDLMQIEKQFNDFSDMLNNMVDAITNISENNRDISRLTVSGEEEIDKLASSSNKVSVSFNGFQHEFEKFVNLITKINNITDVITGLAGQTKLLSLNASIEAARAGEAGRGFAVVADEVNKLSEESKTSADEISNLINTIVQVSDEIMKITGEMATELNIQQDNTDNIAKSLNNIIDNIEKSASKIGILDSSAKGILDEKDRLIDKVVNASSIAEEISASAEEITASAGEMDSYSNKVVHAADILNGIVSETTEELNKFEIYKYEKRLNK